MHVAATVSVDTVDEKTATAPDVGRCRNLLQVHRPQGLLARHLQFGPYREGSRWQLIIRKMRIGYRYDVLDYSGCFPYRVSWVMSITSHTATVNCHKLNSVNVFAQDTDNECVSNHQNR